MHPSPNCLTLTTILLWLCSLLFSGSASALAPTLDLDANDSTATGTSYTSTFTEGGAWAWLTDVDPRITDPDSTHMTRAYAWLTNPQPGDELLISGSPPAGITHDLASYNRYINFTGTATIADYQQVLYRLYFRNTSENPVTTNRSIYLRVFDDESPTNYSNLAYVTITVNAVNDPPTLDMDANNSSGATGNSFQQQFVIGTGETRITIADTDTQLADVDSTSLTRTEITLSSPQAGDRLIEVAPLPAGIILDAASTDSQRIYTGTASLSSYQTLLANVRFGNLLDDPNTTTRSISTTITDDTSLTATATTSVIFSHAPRVDLDGDDSSGATDGDYRTTFLVGNGASTPVADTDAVITDGDPGATLTGLTITLTNPQDGDSLGLTSALPASIAADTGTPGTVTLSGAASLADYTDALKSISFDTGATPLPETRLVSVTATDELDITGNAVTAHIDIGGGLTVSVDDTPYLALSSNDLRYTATVSNSGLTDIEGVTLTAILPDTGTFQAFTGAQLADWDCNIFDYTAICTYLPVLASGTSAALSFEIITPAETGTILGQFTVGSNSPDPYAGDNTTMQQSLVVNYDSGGFVPETRLFDQNATDNDHAGRAVAVDGDHLAIGIPDHGLDNIGAVYAWTRTYGSWKHDLLIQPANPGSDTRYFGTAVAIDGDIMAVGATGAYGTPGAVHIYHWDDLNLDWIEQQVISASNGFANNKFGATLDLQDGTLIVGAPEDFGPGEVYVYNLTGNAFTETARLGSLLPSSADRFGTAVALDQNTLVVGASGYTYLLHNEPPGRAFVFVTTNGTWSLQQELTHNNAASLDYFGRAVAISGDYAVIGAQFNADVGYHSGAAHVYRRYGNYWSYQQQLTALDAVYDEEFGSSLDMQGETIVVGAPAAHTEEAFGDASGAAYVFQLVGPDWVQQQKRSYHDYIIDQPRTAEFSDSLALDGSTLIIGMPRLSSKLPGTLVTEHGLALVTSIKTDPAIELTPATTQGEFGRSVDIGGDTIIIGAPKEEQAGVVYLYTRLGTTWAEPQRITGTSLDPYTAADLAEFGAAVAIDGDRAVVGAPYDSQGGATGNGAVYVLSRSGENWSVQTQLLASAAETDGDRFGFDVDIVGDTILVGAPGDENPAYPGSGDAGSAYTFDVDSNTGQWGQSQQLFPTTGYGFPGGLFGYAVALRADALVIGSPFPGAVAGFAFVYSRGATAWENPLLLEPPTAPGEYGDFGASVAISDYVLLVGAPEITVAGTSNSGNAFEFVNQWGSWTWSSEFNYGTGVTPDSGQLFGFAVATDNETDIASAPYYESGTDSNTGIVYATDRYPDYQVTANDAQGGDSFGYALAINREAMVIGAPFEDGTVLNSDTGKVYVYPRFTSVSVPGGTYNSAQLVELECRTCSSPAHQVWYTLNGDIPVPEGPNSVEYTGPFLIDASATMTYGSFDTANGNALRESIKTETYFIDTASPSATIASPSSGAVIGGIDPVISGTATDPAGGSDIFAVQVQVRDITDPRNEARITTDLWQPALYNAATDAWSLVLDDVSTRQPLISEHNYIIEVRAFDAVGNVSPIVSSQFTYYNGTPAFTTLGLTLSSTSILNNGTLDVSMNLDEPGNLGADLSGLNVNLLITAPDDSVSTITCTTGSDGIVTIDELGGGGPHANCTPASGFTFDREGTYTLQASYGGVYNRLSADSPARIVLVGTAAGYAVLIQGRLAGDEGLTAHNKTANRIYDTLKARGFQDEHIWYFNPDTNQDGFVCHSGDSCPEGANGIDDADCADGDGCNNHTSHPDYPGAPNGIDGPPVQADIAAVFTEPVATPGSLANVMENNPAPLYVIQVDHGNPDIFYLNPGASGGDEVITPDELNTWFGTLESRLGTAALTKPRVIVNGMCYADSFTDTLSAPGRIIIASAAANEESFKGAREADDIRVGEYFLEEFFQRAGRGIDLIASFEYATAVTEIFTRASDSNSPQPPYNDLAVQHPHIDTNGDGVGSNIILLPTGSDPNPDGFLDFDGNDEADPLYLGVGPSYNTNSPDNPADITAVTPTRFLPDGQNTAVLELSANFDAEVFAAWVEIRAPATVLQGLGGSIQLNPDLDKQLLLSPGECQASFGIDSWCTSYGNFTTPGMYEVFYFVQDRVPGESIGGAVSPAWRSVIYKNSSPSTPPADFNLLVPDDGDSARTDLAFDWGSSNDDDGLTYTLEIATDSTFSNVVHRQEELTVSHTTVNESAGLDPNLVTYYWRVIAVDSYGARTEGRDLDTSNPWRSFTTDNGNARRGYIYTTVRDAVSGVTLSGATVTLSESYTTLDIYEDSGEYTLVIEPVGTYTVNAALADYDNNSVAGVDADLSPSIAVDLSAAAGADGDGDGIVDSVDNCPVPNPGQEDNDSDGQGDVCDTDDDNDGVLDVNEPARGTDPLLADTDTDGAGDATDNCPVTPNAGQENNDGDGQGDACDPDDDNDTVNDPADNCPFVANSDQTNTDVLVNFNPDTLGDACDSDDDGDGVLDTNDDFPLNPFEISDTDGDGVGDNSDNCVNIGNTNQTDTDGDGDGNVCDSDDDDDGLSDTLETNTFGTDPLLADTDGDTLQDGTELGLGTDPLDPDTDGDGFSDGEEVAAGTSPLDNTDMPVTADGNVAPRGNIDAEVNAADYLIMMRFVLGLNTDPTQLELAHGDLDGSGVIDLPDLILLMQIIQAAP